MQIVFSLLSAAFVTEFPTFWSCLKLQYIIMSVLCLRSLQIIFEDICILKYSVHGLLRISSTITFQYQWSFKKLNFCTALETSHFACLWLQRSITSLYKRVKCFLERSSPLWVKFFFFQDSVLYKNGLGKSVQ